MKPFAAPTEATSESDMERDLRVSGPTMAEGWNRLARMIEAYTELTKPHLETED